MKIEDKIQVFLQQKKDEIIQVIIAERKSNGEGVLFVYFLPAENKVDCTYIPFHCPTFPKMYLKHYTERKGIVPSSVLFLQFLDQEEKNEVLFELDLDVRNNCVEN